MKDNQFEQTLEYLYGLLPMYQRQGASAIKKDLTNVKTLCWDLGLPQWQFKSVHIAGTNGKGSVASMFQSILKEAGYTVGLYTSPHLVSFTERIRINGKPIPEKEIVSFVHAHQELIEKVNPSFFELTVAIAFDYFARKEVDIAVIETGLGGRLDSTNIVEPELSVITNISWDHQAILGNSLAEIAGEKAGIIKRFTPVVIGESMPETDKVFIAKAGVVEAPLEFADQQYKMRVLKQELDKQQIEVSRLDEEGDIEDIQTYWLDLAGSYQLHNLGTVLSGINRLQEDGWEIPDNSIKRGLKKVKLNAGLRGRMEKISENPLVLCDTGHNEAGVSSVIAQLKQFEYKRLHVVWGMVADKEHHRILQLLPKDASYYWVSPNVPRGLGAINLQLKAEGLGLEGVVCDSVRDGLKKAKAASEVGDLIFVGGSTFVVGEVLEEDSVLV